MSPEEQPTPGYHDDEIDLRDLALMLIEGWYWIVGMVVLAVVAAFAYLAVTTPTFETSFHAVPASVSNFSGYNLMNGFEITPGEAYRTLGNRLSSFQNFERFVEDNQDRFRIDPEADLGQVFANRLTVGGLAADGNSQLMMNIGYRYPEGEEGAEILNDYVGDTAEQVWATLRNRFEDHNRAQLASLFNDLQLQKETLKRSREDELFTLEQAIAVARRLDIEKPTTPQQFGRQPSGSEVIYANIGNDGSLPLYFMGYEALEADRDTMKASIDDGLSNMMIREIEQKFEQRKRISRLLSSNRLYGVDEGVEPNHTERVVDVVEYAFRPASPSEPPKALILSLSLIVGGMVGVMLVFLARFAGSLRGYREMKRG
ncbi:Wzz/FepE/Etk N-terminal domain-containing protein [Halomonas rhizosphaerae]|uniref:Wzz/FepE/Etk N-terminal domain-containing protein n=1 Tax=Halomonas rhizosphaerae TaxID=3043296 RepID=A0ABT6UZC5_9GAMM|nr:Wzz/FepE/Etk N-terminal domain-containing protein [Halomonas rhizosphaerae]MDI5891327.1 Wzz/FepE/Etk N-terminal domain-containing protein [Halomonas rhizosphaerae]